MSVSSDPLRVTITRSGGVAGVRRVWSVEVRSLSAEQSAELRRLVAAAEEPRAAAGGAPPNSSRPSPGVPDAFSYTMDVERRTGHRRTVTGPVTDTAAPIEAVRRLLDFLRTYGTPKAVG